MRKLCFSLVRSLVIIVNLVVIALASLLIYASFNAFNREHHRSLESYLDPGQPRLVHLYVSIILAGLGLITAILALLGLIGAAKKSKSILSIYAVIVSVLIFGLAIMVIISHTMLQSGPAATDPSSATNQPLGTGHLIAKEVDKSFVNSTIILYNYIDTNDLRTRIIDNVQTAFSCCGVNSPNDWVEFSQKIPKSCCSDHAESHLPAFKYCTESNFKVGCYKALSDYFYENVSTVRMVIYGLIAFGLVCASAAFYMIVILRKSLDIV